MPSCSPDHCHNEPPPTKGYRVVLWVALAANLAMFFVEFASGFGANSASLLADAVDFFGDAANYGVSLFVLGMSLHTRAKATLLKGASMALFGLVVFGMAAWNWHAGNTPEHLTMGVVAVLALLTNLGVAWLLYSFRQGDSNMRSVWLCSRNDAIGNVAVIVAAFAVAYSGSLWPDLIVAMGMATLALYSANSVIRQALGELRTPE